MSKFVFLRIPFNMRRFVILCHLLHAFTVAAQPLTWQRTAPVRGEWMSSFASIGDVVFTGGSMGLYRSFDYGVHWTLILPGVYADVLVASDSILHVADRWSKRVQRSTDFGKSWTTVQVTTSNGEYVVSFASAPGKLYACGSDRLYVSENKGESWQQDSSGADAPQRICVAGDYLFAYFDYEVQRSADNGKTWVPITLNNDQFYFGNGIMDYAYHNGALYLCRSYYEPGLVSTDLGVSWQQVSVGTDDSIMSEISSTGDVLYVRAQKANHYGNTYRSTDNGKSWTNIEDKLGNSYGAYWFHRAGEHVYAYRNGVLRLDTDGSWQEVNNGFNQRLQTSSALVLRDKIFNAIYWEYLHLSTDGGETWQSMKDQLQQRIAQLRYRAPYLYAYHMQGFYRSADSGRTWNTLSTPITPGLQQWLFTNEHGLLLGTDSSLYFSPDHGETWEAMHLEIDSAAYPFNSYAHGFALSKTHVYLSSTSLYRRSFDDPEWTTVPIPDSQYGAGPVFPFDDMLFLCQNHKIYRSSDSGNSWMHLTNGAPEHFQTMVKKGDLLVGGMWRGTYSSTDNGDSWQKDIGVDQFLIRQLSSDGATLIAAGDSGVFRAAAGSAVRAGERSDETLRLAVSGTQLEILYTLDDQYPVSIAIFDILGRKQRSLLDEVQIAGKHRLTSTIASLPGGAYLVRLANGREAWTELFTKP